MAKNQKGKGPGDTEQLKAKVAELIKSGYNVSEALSQVSRSRSWYESHRRQDREWADLLDRVRVVSHDSDVREIEAGEFADFSEKYLGLKVYPHMQNVVDLLEGREPGWLPDGMLYERGTSGHRRICVNVPPNHGKTMTVSIGYATYRLVKDPSMSIIIISKTLEMSKKILYAIKQRLTHPAWTDMQLAFAPADGWKATADQWSATRIYLDRSEDMKGSKDPSVESLGMGGQVYGARADLIILDDVVTLSNAHEWDKQMEWIRQEVSTRLGPGGQLLVVGTRVAPMDLYSELRNPEHYTDGAVPWTSLSMPAVLKYAEVEEDWETLWPWADEAFVEGDQPNDAGLFPRWTGSRLARVRNEVGPRKWQLVYMNTDVEQDSVFEAAAVRGSVNEGRKVGPFTPGSKHHPANTSGFYTICSMDPAVAGNTAAVAYSVNRNTGERWLLDCQVIPGPTPAQIRDVIRNMTEVYQPREWVIEANAFQGFLVHDEGITQWLANKGIILRPHFTGKNKMDEDFGVASMSGLFGTVADVNGLRKHQKDNLILLPSTQTMGMKLMVEELIAWSPEVPTKRRRQDTVMALWFAELRAREVIQTTGRERHMFVENPYLAERELSKQMTVNLDELLAEQYENEHPEGIWPSWA